MSVDFEDLEAKPGPARSSWRAGSNEPGLVAIRLRIGIPHLLDLAKTRMAEDQMAAWKTIVAVLGRWPRTSDAGCTNAARHAAAAPRRAAQRSRP